MEVRIIKTSKKFKSIKQAISYKNYLISQGYQCKLCKSKDSSYYCIVYSITL